MIGLLFFGRLGVTTKDWASSLLDPFIRRNNSLNLPRSEELLLNNGVSNTEI